MTDPASGRSCYLFDLDDNILRLPTVIRLQHTAGGSPVDITTSDLARLTDLIGKAGRWEDYSIDADSFVRFRDNGQPEPQPFIEDMRAALEGDTSWKGPSWDVFRYAIEQSRPISIITAREHTAETIRIGIALLHEHGHLPRLPEYLGVFPVGLLRRRLGNARGSAELKRSAIIQSVERARERYGSDAPHQFGMSDDDPVNIQRIIEAMRELKGQFPNNRFFVIDTSLRQVYKAEVPDGTETLTWAPVEPRQPE